ncbi:MAG: hypothetical protein HY268_12785 [Deltaproteobacteria bacterium]|nr:hypothetical protein [Deltaproteobacteria bacterium]
MEVANSIESASEKAVALALLANAYAKAGQYDRALQVANTIEDASQKAWALGSIAPEYAKAGQFDKAVQIANSIEKDTRKAWTLVTLYTQAGQYDRALQMARSIESGLHKSMALAEIASAYVRIGQYDRALQTVDTVEIIESKRVSSKARVLAAIGGRYAQTGQKMDEKARKLLRQAIKSVDDSSTSTERGGTPENPLLGKWQNPNTNETFEFFKDGAVNVFGGGPPSGGGQYAVVDDSHVRLQVFRLSGPGATVWKFAVSRDQLTLTSPEGRVAMYRKVK